MSWVSPAQSKGEALQEILNQFSTRTPEALMAMAATREGLSIASVKQQIISDEEDALAVAGARILDMAAEVNNQLNQGQIGRILIEGIERTTIVMGAGRDIVFIVVVPAGAKLGLAMLSIQNTAKLIADLYN
jgi:predicted regulator of Ras-like GTPase activity (Roadblock/LC7/MglB family)